MELSLGRLGSQPSGNLLNYVIILSTGVLAGTVHMSDLSRTRVSLFRTLWESVAHGETLGDAAGASPTPLS